MALTGNNIYDAPGRFNSIQHTSENTMLSNGDKHTHFFLTGISKQRMVEKLSVSSVIFYFGLDFHVMLSAYVNKYFKYQ